MSQIMPSQQAKILDANVTTPKIADASVTTPKLADAAVTPMKLSSAGATTGQALTFDGTSIVWGAPALSVEQQVAI
jgi:hypothetical protein